MKVLYVEHFKKQKAFSIIGLIVELALFVRLICCMVQENLPVLLVVLFTSIVVSAIMLAIYFLIVAMLTYLEITTERVIYGAGLARNEVELSAVIGYSYRQSKRNKSAYTFVLELPAKLQFKFATCYKDLVEEVLRSVNVNPIDNDTNGFSDVNEQNSKETK